MAGYFLTPSTGSIDFAVAEQIVGRESRKREFNAGASEQLHLQLLTGDSDQKCECEKASLFNRKCG